jgi:hypothetical protein
MSWAVYQPEDLGIEELVVTSAEHDQYRQGRPVAYRERFRGRRASTKCVTAVGGQVA